MRQPIDTIRILLALVAAVLLVACSSNKYPPAPTAAATSDYKYVIGPLDTVNIVVWRNPELSMAVPVRPDGRISTPLVEDVPALGKNPGELARDLEKALSKYIRDPVVTVIVNNFNGPSNEQIRIIGEAAKPQAVAYRQNMTVLDVMIAGRRPDGLCGRQQDRAGPRLGAGQAVQRPARRPGAARRHFGERRHAPGRRAHHPAELVLVAAARYRARVEHSSSLTGRRWTSFCTR